MKIDLKSGEPKVVKPITPGEVTQKKAESLPPEVLEAFNELIAENWDGRESTFKLSEAVARIRKKVTVPKGESPGDKGWLDIEDIYRKAGWKVEYDQPAYNETYPATYTFSKKK